MLKRSCAPSLSGSDAGVRVNTICFVVRLKTDTSSGRCPRFSTYWSGASPKASIWPWLE